MYPSGPVSRSLPSPEEIATTRCRRPKARRPVADQLRRTACHCRAKRARSLVGPLDLAPLTPDVLCALSGACTAPCRWRRTPSGPMEWPGWWLDVGRGLSGCQGGLRRRGWGGPAPRWWRGLTYHLRLAGSTRLSPELFLHTTPSGAQQWWQARALLGMQPPVGMQPPRCASAPSARSSWSGRPRSARA